VSDAPPVRSCLASNLSNAVRGEVIMKEGCEERAGVGSEATSGRGFVSIIALAVA